MSKNLLNPYIKAIFRGVRPGWKKIIFSPGLKAHFQKCMRELETYLRKQGITSEDTQRNGLKTYIRPAENNIFECMKYFDPQNLRVIIVGQDPYLKPNEAHGLSFSVPKTEPIPPSLNKIYQTLLEQDLISKMPDHGNLVGWARQGVLLLNRYLTRSPNIKKSEGRVYIEGNGSSDNLHEFWACLTDELISYLTGPFMQHGLNHPEHKLYVMLWGGHAQKCRMFVNKDDLPPGREVVLLEWGHPSPLNRANNDPDNGKNFSKCDHFAIVSAAMSINWDPSYISDRSLLSQFRALSVVKSAAEDVGEDVFDVEKIPIKNLYDDMTDEIHNLIVRTYLAKLKSSGTEKYVVVSVDGSCKGNHIKDSSQRRGGFGVYFPSSFDGIQNHESLSELCIFGKTRPYAMETRDVYEEDKEASKEEVPFAVPFEDTDIPAAITNNRSELLAWIYALSRIIITLRDTEPAKLIVVSDSEYCTKLIKQRLWNHLRAGEDLHTVKENVDLIKIIYELLKEYGKMFNEDDLEKSLITEKRLLIHKADSHPEEKGLSVPEQGTKEWDIHVCNHRADHLCNLALESENPINHVQGGVF